MRNEHDKIILIKRLSHMYDLYYYYYYYYITIYFHSF